mmetsp:Transcript_39303/g.100725  ORF Transcript_39303/g.100725 Transcript_39303/m.100725 type:complete len:89 (-) Transcript_39303:2056-2322(-)
MAAVPLVSASYLSASPEPLREKLLALRLQRQLASSSKRQREKFAAAVEAEAELRRSTSSPSHFCNSMRPCLSFHIFQFVEASFSLFQQ